MGSASVIHLSQHNKRRGQQRNGCSPSTKTRAFTVEALWLCKFYVTWLCHEAAANATKHIAFPRAFHQESSLADVESARVAKHIPAQPVKNVQTSTRKALHRLLRIRFLHHPDLICDRSERHAAAIAPEANPSSSAIFFSSDRFSAQDRHHVPAAFWTASHEICMPGAHF